MPRFRLAILGASPCHLCHANCCKQNGHDYAVLLEEHEWPRFAPFCEAVRIDAGTFARVERLLPYREGRCQFLDADDRCTIYEDRPVNCRRFECAAGFDPKRQSEFLRRNPDVLDMLERL